MEIDLLVSLLSQQTFLHDKLSPALDALCTFECALLCVQGRLGAMPDVAGARLGVEQ